jgi:hypothetical protein
MRFSVTPASKQSKRRGSMRKGERYYLGGTEIDLEDAIDEHGVVRDGVTLHVPLHLRDGLPDGGGTVLADAFGREPSYVRSDAAAREAKARAWQDANDEAENAWRGAAVVAGNAVLTLDAAMRMDDAARRAVKEAAWNAAQLADEGAWRAGPGAAGPAAGNADTTTWDALPAWTSERERARSNRRPGTRRSSRTRTRGGAPGNERRTDEHTILEKRITAALSGEIASADLTTLISGFKATGPPTAQPAQLVTAQSPWPSAPLRVANPVPGFRGASNRRPVSGHSGNGRLWCLDRTRRD